MDQTIASIMVSNALYFVVTNTNPIIDKSGGIQIQVYCDMSANYQLSQDIFTYLNTFLLIKNPDQSYSVPNLSSFSTTISSSVPFNIPTPSPWAHVEVGYNGTSSPFEIDDKYWTNNPIGSDGFLYLQTRDITNLASSGGNLWMKIILFDNGYFQVFNGDGNTNKESPIVLGLSHTKTNLTVTANGGSSGRGFILQSSTNLTAWANCSGINFISATNDLPNVTPAQFVYQLTNSSSFYRTMTTNTPPTY